MANKMPLLAYQVFTFQSDRYNNDHFYFSYVMLYKVYTTFGLRHVETFLCAESKGPHQPVHPQSNQDPVVESVVSLTSLLRVISLTVLVDSIYNILRFFAEKM